MEVSNVQNHQVDLSTKKDKVYISQELWDKAKEFSHHPNKTAVIFGEQTMAIENDILDTLKMTFPNSFSKHDNILLAKNEAKEYLNKIANLVLNELNVANADVDKNGMISMAESLDTRNTINEFTGTISKPRDYLPVDLIRIVEQDNSNFMSINDILNLHIELDKNKDGDVTIKEIIDDATPKNYASEPLEPGDQNILEELYEQQRELEKKISDLMSKMAGMKNEEDILLAQDQLNSLNTQLSAINAKIMSILDELKKS
jgi:DNA-binding transcriptional MerR regulator